jgi:hypothetical protein
VATKRQCEGWVGQSKQDFCSRSGRKETQKYMQVTQGQRIRFGWVCLCCDKFQPEYEFARGS